MLDSAGSTLVEWGRQQQHDPTRGAQLSPPEGLECGAQPKTYATVLCLPWSDHNKGLECVKCGARCHKKCISLKRNEVVKCQRLISLICNHCHFNAGDQERCSACVKGLRLHHTIQCSINTSVMYMALPATLLANNYPAYYRGKLKTAYKQWSCCSHIPVSSQPSKSFPSTSSSSTTVGCSTCDVCKRSIPMGYQRAVRRNCIR